MRNILLLSLAAAAAAAQAVPQLNISGLALGNTASLALSNVSGMADGTYYAGPFSANLPSGPTFRVFCADLLNHTVYNSPTNVNPQDTATLGAGYQQAGRLINKYASLVGNDPVMNAALQGAIWKSIFPTLNYADGTAGTAALTATYLASPDLGTYSDHATYYDFGGANQSMIGVQAVPEPASMAALGVGALGLLRRRRKAR